jgi:glycosyltransferase involved in cell wall biosynthesis
MKTSRDNPCSPALSSFNMSGTSSGFSAPPSQKRTSPFFSIIIPTFNSAATIDRTLESIAAQDCGDFEVIVSDGASTDRTLEIVSRYDAYLRSVTVLSAPDNGVYDAINRAIGVTRGRWVHVLGSDDCLHLPTVLSHFRQELEHASEPIVYGDVIVRGKTGRPAPDGERYAGELTLPELLKRNICQQAIFYRRELFDWIGVFEPRYQLCADWHFVLRALTRFRGRWVDAVVCDYNAGGLSSRGVDLAFLADYPAFLLRLFATRPLRRDFGAMRPIFLEHSQACRGQGRFLRSIVFSGASFWLRAHEKLFALAHRLAPKEMES